MGGSADTEDTAGTEGEARQELGSIGPANAGGQVVLRLAGDGRGGDGHAAVKSSDALALSASPTGAESRESTSSIASPSDPPTPSLASGCPAVSATWSQGQAMWNGNPRTSGTYSCNADIPAISNGVTITGTLNGTDRVGSIQLSCSNGTWLFRSASCNGSVLTTAAISGISSTCSSADPVSSKWIGWYLADLKRCADTAGLNWWVNNYNNDADCLVTDNYRGWGSKDACWRAQLRIAADANGGTYSEAQATGHVAASSEAALCNGKAYPWTSVASFGTSCKALP